MNSPRASATSAAPPMGADLIPANTARLLVGGGLLPFVALSGGSVLMDGAHAALFHFPLVAYGAVILSFVGALHWGIALSHPAASLRDRKVMIGWSVVPALLGWAAMLLMPGPDLLVLATAFWAHLGFDVRAVRRLAMPGWYLPLRFVATAIASLSLMLPVMAGNGSYMADPHLWLKGAATSTQILPAPARTHTAV